MTANRVVSTNEYLSSTKSVLNAGKELQRVLKVNAPLKRRENAIRKLEQAGQRHDLGAKSYRAFMFSEAETESIVEKAPSPQTSADLLASVLNDLQVAGVYIAAGQNTGETKKPPQPALLKDALNRLQETTTAIEQSLTGPEAQRNIPSRFGFVEDKGEMQVVSSADLKSAITTFQTKSDQTLNEVIDEAEEVVTLVIDYLNRLGPEKVLTALQSLGGPVREISTAIGRFIGQGIEKIKSAVNTLLELFGNSALARIKDEIVKLWNDVTGGGIVSYLLRKAFAVQTTSDNIAIILKRDGLDKDKLDQASNDLAQLMSPYRNDMAIAKKATQAVSFAAAVLFVIPIVAPKAALLAGFAYGLVLSGVVLVGMDYADSGRILRRVRGVGEIANSLLPE